MKIKCLLTDYQSNDESDNPNRCGDAAVLQGMSRSGGTGNSDSKLFAGTAGKVQITLSNEEYHSIRLARA